MVEKRRQGKNTVLVNRFYRPFSNEVRKVFAKEAGLLNIIDNKYFRKIVGSIRNPLAIMMVYLEFSFMPFGRYECFNSLDKLLNIIDKDDSVKGF